jgi:hypothetical protein
MSVPPFRGVMERVRACREPRVAARLARLLWIVWAVLLWNVVFDHVIVVAGREYIAAATTPGAPRVNMDAFMRPAVRRGFWIASAAGGGVLVAGLAAVGAAKR